MLQYWWWVLFSYMPVSFCGSNQVILGRDLRSNTDSIWSFYREKYLEIASGSTIFGASNDNS